MYTWLRDHARGRNSRGCVMSSPFPFPSGPRVPPMAPISRWPMAVAVYVNVCGVGPYLRDGTSDEANGAVGLAICLGASGQARGAV